MKKRYLYILMFGVFSILNTEMGVVGILPTIAQEFHVSLSQAGLLVSLFALVVAFSGPTLPLIFSRFNRKKVMVGVLATFTICNLISAFTSNFTMLLIMRILPAFFHPVYISMALASASMGVEEKDIPKATAIILMGVSAGMVLGAPVVGAISNALSLQAGMLFFALINAIALIVTILFIPSMPVDEVMSYGEQLHVLKRKSLWFAIIGVIFLNGAIYGVYSYISAFLESVTGLSANWISILLFVYGIFNILGNNIAGSLLSTKPKRFIVSFPIVLILLYALLLFGGQFIVPTVICIVLWGIMTGAGASINQYCITSEAKEAPEFSNGIFLAATNLGTAISTPMCGGFISTLGTPFMFLCGMLLLVCSLVFLISKVKAKALA